jgi:hypothetical protein
MWTLTSILVGFLVVSAGVAALARSTTARWERERRAAVNVARRRLTAGIRRHGRRSTTPRRTHQLAARDAHGRRERRTSPVSDEYGGPGQ